MLLFIGVQSFQPNASGSYRPLIVPAWSDFEFAPNGVCISPACFVVEKSSSSSSSRTDNDNNSNNNLQEDAPTSFTLRNVPGTGDCMFQAVALASFASVGLGGNNALLRAITKELRDLTARVLEQGQGHLVIQGKRLVKADDLLQQATRQEGLESKDEYLRVLRLQGADGGLYGGGPELTVLCNLLRRPISIYELAKSHKLEESYSNNSHGMTTNTTMTTSISDDESLPTAASFENCPIVCKGTFGGPIFDDPLVSVPNSAVTTLGQTFLPGASSWHLHILVVETSPTLKHACVLLPQRQQQQSDDDDDDDEVGNPLIRAS